MKNFRELKITRFALCDHCVGQENSSLLSNEIQIKEKTSLTKTQM